MSLFTLASSKINFDVIGVSETWDSVANPLNVNVEVPGYKYFAVQSHGQNGGIVLYVKIGLIPIPRPDLSNDSADFESVWVEVHKKMGKLICSVVHIIIQAQILIILMNISSKPCPTQLYSISKLSFLGISILTS